MIYKGADEMNEKFIAAVKKAGITGYKLSKKTGIPYTTISELLTGKKDINKKRGSV